MAGLSKYCSQNLEQQQSLNCIRIKDPLTVRIDIASVIITDNQEMSNKDPNGGTTGYGFLGAGAGAYSGAASSASSSSAAALPGAAPNGSSALPGV